MFTRQEIQMARSIPLAEFLYNNDIVELERTGRQWRLADNHSVKFNDGVSGFMDWGTGNHGNTIDFLAQYLGFSFCDAVTRLLEYEKDAGGGKKKEYEASVGELSGSVRSAREFVLPEKAQNNRRVFAYLTITRGISRETVNRLIRDGLLYQEPDYNNAVFVTVERDYYQEHGTLSYGKPFHRSFGENGDESWYFTGDGQIKPARIYITEAAIDAVSLYELCRESDSCYCAIGGAGKQKAIDRMKGIADHIGAEVIIATDNDTTGDDCRNRNAGFGNIRPKNKDWNEDLMRATI